MQSTFLQQKSAHAHPYLRLIALILIGSCFYLYTDNGQTPTVHAESATTSTPATEITTALTYTKVAAGDDQTCALTSAGGVQCWGDNADGQAGDGSDFPSRPPSNVVGLESGVTDIAAGGNHSCALLGTGAIKCWGRNSNGQLGDNTTDERLIPVDVLGLPATPTALVGGEAHTCALFGGGAVNCWGRNDRGQLGDGSTADRHAPTAVSGLAAGAVEVIAGFAHSCARLVNGGVQCWGDNSQGQLGDGSQNNSSTPVNVVSLGAPAIALTAGFYHTCAALQDGSVACWGDNARGQLGDESREDRTQPVAVQKLNDSIAKLAAGRYHTCALAIDGDVHCWGSSSRGQLGTGSLESSRTPARVIGLGTDSVAIAAGEEHSCAILKSGALRCWGSNRDRQLGEGSPGLYSVPQLLIPNRATGTTTPIGGIAAIVPGRYHTCLITNRRGVECWGRNSDGQLGDGSNIPHAAPVAVVGLESGIVALALGAEHSCALRQNGTVLCWGSNQYGQLGDGTQEQRATPVEVSGITDGVAAIVAGDNHTCALMQGGGAKCWGQNSSGQLGDGTTTDTSFPVTVGGLSGAIALAAGLGHSCALLPDSVRCWGENSSGQLGDGTVEKRLAPTPVTGLPAGTLVALATGDRHSCAVVAGAVYCWGNNGDGQLGNGEEVNQTQPVAVQGISDDVRMVGAGASHSCGLTTDGALYCWGGNEQSQLGDGSTEDRATAAVVSGLAANVLALQAGGYHNCVLVTGNRPLCWGNDSDGQLATGVLSQSALPVALGNAPTVHIESNSTIGQPGSTFTLIGDGFAPNATLPVIVNGNTLSATIQSNIAGSFIVYLTTDGLAAGSYDLQIGSTAPVAKSFFLQPASELRRAEGAGETIALPAGSERALTTIYMPILRR